MTLQEFRATRRVLTRDAAETEFPYLAEVEYSPEYTHVIVYGNGFHILQSRAGFYLTIETSEYQTDDLALLEFVLWQWADDSAENETLRAMIWG